MIASFLAMGVRAALPYIGGAVVAILLAGGLYHVWVVRGLESRLAEAEAATRQCQADWKADKLKWEAAETQRLRESTRLLRQENDRQLARLEEQLRAEERGRRRAQRDMLAAEQNRKELINAMAERDACPVPERVVCLLAVAAGTRQGDCLPDRTVPGPAPASATPSIPDGAAH